MYKRLGLAYITGKITIERRSPGLSTWDNVEELMQGKATFRDILRSKVSKRIGQIDRGGAQNECSQEICPPLISDSTTNTRLTTLVHRLGQINKVKY